MKVFSITQNISFPEKKTAYIKLYKNKFLLSRPTSKTANSQTKKPINKVLQQSD